MKSIILLAGTVTLMLTSGCTCLHELRDEITELKIMHNNCSMAKESYSDIDDECMCECCPNSFRSGYLSGYISVCNGGTGCLPPFPQIRCCNFMWLDFCPEYEKHETWYRGYELGARTAKAEGMTDVNKIATRLPGQCDCNLQPFDDPALAPLERGSLRKEIPELAPDPAPPAPTSSDHGETDSPEKRRSLLSYFGK